VESRTDAGRWVAHDGRQWTADDTTRIDMIALADGAQPLTPTGPYYTPAGPDDEVAAYLTAVRVVPAPQVTGEPPRVPTPPASSDEQGVVY
jgi:hypothetical protein